MVLKRHFHEQEGDGFGASDQESKRQHTIKTVRDVLKGLSLDELALRMEPFLRKVVREEVERVVLLSLHPSSRSSHNQIDSSEARGWLLHFVNKLPSTIFTGSRIEAEDNTPVEIVILDAISKNTVTVGPLSSIKIEVLVLDDDFGNDELEDWTEEEFNAHVVRERDGKRPLVTGDRHVTLRNGVGCIGDISFTDNSSWRRNRKFRLGARIVQKTSNDVRIREARSEAFVVKDHRGELYKKHYPPSLDDEVWRLERIAKDGKFHTRLASNRIKTVKDFLQLYVTKPASLRSILGCGSSNRTWETIIEHATACVLDHSKWYIYDGTSQGVRLLFNSIYEVEGVIFAGQNFLSRDKLNSSQMHLVEGLKQLAYRNLNDLVPIDDPSVLDPSRPLLSPQANPFDGQSLALQHLSFPVTNQEMQLGFNDSTSPAYTYEVGANSQLQVSASQPMQVFAPTLINSFVMRDSCTGPYSGGSGWTPSESLGPALLTGHLAVDDISQVQTSTWFPVPETWGQGNSFVFASSSEGEVSFLSPLPSKPKAGWCKIRAAVKCLISVKRVVAAKKRTASFWYVDRLLESGC